MAIGVVNDEGSVFIEKELIEGTFVPESDGSKAIEVLSDGLEMTPTKELLERNNRTSTVEKVVSRVGQKSMSGTIPTEFKAGSIEGQAPETTALYEALLGGKAEYAETISDVGHSANVIALVDGDADKYEVGYIVKIKESGNNVANLDHISPIIAVDKGVGTSSITLLVPYSQNFSDNVIISAGVAYYHQSGQPTLSITNYLGGKIREKAIGMRCVSGELSNFATGQLPQLSFSLEGLDYAREVGTPLFAPTYDTSLPPVVLCAKVYQDDSEIPVNNVGISMSNTLGFLTSTASCSGKISSRITEFVSTFSFNPYMEDDDVEQFDKFNKNEGYSVFGSAQNYGATDTEYKEVVSFYMPNCRSTEIATGDEDGILTDAVSGQAYKNLGNDTIFICFV